METSADLLKRLVESIASDGDMISAAVLQEGSASGADIPQGHITKIKKWTRVEQAVESLHTFPVLMIDTAPTRNRVIYTAESQKKSIKDWQGTTFLFNHTAQSSGGIFGGSADHTLQAASQMGRIYESRLVKTPKGETGSLAYFYSVEGIDANTDGFIRKLEAGILREVSIHVSVPEGVICSLCNDTFGNCEKNAGEYHYPGEQYAVGKNKKKETCYMSTGTAKLVPLELSAVACPGSVNAHVMQDDEVEDYPVVSLREALGASAGVIQSIRQENNVKTEAEITAAREKLVEAAKTAGVTIRAFVEDATNKEAVEAADVTAETVETLFPEIKPADPVVPPVVSPVVAPKTEKNHLFADRDCVVCGRGKESAPVDEPAAVVALRAEFVTQVEEVVTASDAAVKEANDRATAAETQAADAQAMFADVVEETVTLAIERGVKKSNERDAYREKLASLSYQAVREIRESYRASSKPTVEQQREALHETSAERAKRELGQTQVATTESGTQTSTTGRRARFAATTK